MIAPISNVIFSLVAVPVFAWEPVEEPADDPLPAAPPPPSGCESTDGSAEQTSQTSSSTTNLRLVFKGFQWRTGFEYALYPAPWANMFDGGTREEREQSVQSENDRRQRANDAARQAALVARQRVQQVINKTEATGGPEVPTETPE
jgi:hypothetical protein